MKTFDQWWEDQPIARLPDSSRVAYLRDLAHRVWISAQQAMQQSDPIVEAMEEFKRADIMQKLPSMLSYNELIVRAESVFIENSVADLRLYPFQHLVIAIRLEEADRRHGTRPNYRIEDVCMDDEWISR